MKKYGQHSSLKKTGCKCKECYKQRVSKKVVRQKEKLEINASEEEAAELAQELGDDAYMFGADF